MSDLPCAWRADTRPTSSAAGPFCLSGLDACAVERFRRAAHARADSVWAVPQGGGCASALGRFRINKIDRAALVGADLAIMEADARGPASWRGHRGWRTAGRACGRGTTLRCDRSRPSVARHVDRTDDEGVGCIVPLSRSRADVDL